MGIGKDFAPLMNDIGYNFIDVSFLETALTHSSYTNEMKQKGFRAESNEALEFLGDAVLEIVISEYLFDRHKHLSFRKAIQEQQVCRCRRSRDSWFYGWRGILVPRRWNRCGTRY